MRVVVGIDTKDAYRPTLDLIRKINFFDSNVTLLHAAPNECPIAGVDAPTQAQYERVVQNLGLAALEKAAARAKEIGLKASTSITFGRAADSLIKEAKRKDADMVALCETHRGRGSVYLGSATWALATNCPTSLLIVKGAVSRSRRLVAVLAADHAEHSDKWVDRFIGLQPKGITHIHVVSPYDVVDNLAAIAHQNSDKSGVDIERWLEQTVSQMTASLVDKLESAGFEVSHSVVRGRAATVVGKAIRDHKASLLIVGSLANTELPIGSTVLHETLAEPSHVLLMRS
jgi:nucleotide-binding universal stress UspA family protein